MKLWNIGSGPAIVRAVGLHVYGTRLHAEASLVGKLPQNLPIGAGLAADIVVSSPKWPEEAWLERAEGALTIDYVRASGVKYRTTSKVAIEGDIVLCKTYERTLDES
jgi:hypothetical protein